MDISSKTCAAAFAIASSRYTAIPSWSPCNVHFGKFGCLRMETSLLFMEDTSEHGKARDGMSSRVSIDVRAEASCD